MTAERPRHISKTHSICSSYVIVFSNAKQRRLGKILFFYSLPSKPGDEQFFIRIIGNAEEVSCWNGFGKPGLSGFLPLSRFLKYIYRLIFFLINEQNRKWRVLMLVRDETRVLLSWPPLPIRVSSSEKNLELNHGRWEEIRHDIYFANWAEIDRTKSMLFADKQVIFLAVQLSRHWNLRRNDPKEEWRRQRKFDVNTTGRNCTKLELGDDEIQIFNHDFM